MRWHLEMEKKDRQLHTIMFQFTISITVNKASEGDEIPPKLFQILKVDAVKLQHSICQQI